MPGCFGSLFKSSKAQAEYTAPYSQPREEPARAPTCKQVSASIPKEAAHFEPCGCGEIGDAILRLMTEDQDLPAYSSSEEKFSDEVRETIRSTISSYASKLTEISLYISDHPEEGFEEHKAAAKLTSFLESEGFPVEKKYKDLSTSFRASYTHGKGGRTFAFCSEYDALPGVGHACGHNLIAVSGVAALLGLRAALRKHDIAGTVTLIGTPAEEGGVGKGILIERGAFKDVDACMMVHPTGLMGGHSSVGGVLPTLAIIGLNVNFHGKTSHAGQAPWDGVNALDAANIAYSSVSALRQQMHPTDRVHGIITKGGDRPNIVPDLTRMEYYIRAQTRDQVLALAQKLKDIFDGAGKATGCKVEYETTPMMYELRNNGPLSEEFAQIVKDDFGIPCVVALDDYTGAGASTDFGNVTYEVPACHPHYAIPATEGRSNHTPEFRDRCRSKKAHELTYDFAAGIASTGARFIKDDKFAEETKRWWKEDMKKVKKP